MKKLKVEKVVFFDASVILAGLASPRGGSAILLNSVKNKKLRGLISELILDEVVRRANKIGLTKNAAETATLKIFQTIIAAPDLKSVKFFSKIVSDPGDVHVLASAKQIKATFLVSLDKKHILSLKKKMKFLQIVTPKELIEIISKK